MILCRNSKGSHWQTIYHSFKLTKMHYFENVRNVYSLYILYFNVHNHNSHYIEQKITK